MLPVGQTGSFFDPQVEKKSCERKTFIFPSCTIYYKKSILYEVKIITCLGDLFVVVFSMDCRETFEEAIRLREAILETKKSATQGATKNRHKINNTLKVPMIIAGNKCDQDLKYVFYIKQ